MRIDNLTKPGTHSQAALSQAAGATKGQQVKLGKGPFARTFEFKGAQFIDTKTGKVATKAQSLKLQNKLSGNTLMGRGVNFYRSYPTLMKFLKFPLKFRFFGLKTPGLFRDFLGDHFCVFLQ